MAESSKKLSRRRFLTTVGVSATGAVLAACGAPAATPNPGPRGGSTSTNAAAEPTTAAAAEPTTGEHHGR